MSLYFEASALIENTDPSAGSLKSRVFGNKKLKSPPGALFALVTEATKWSQVLSEVIDKSGLLAIERKLTPSIALLLVHDLLLSKKGIAAPKQHALTLSAAKHKARLGAELTKCRLRSGFATIEEFRAHINFTTASEDVPNGSSFHPRWIRVNTIKASLDAVLSTTLSFLTTTTSLNELATKPKTIYVDPHIPNLFAVHPSTDLSKSSAYLKGEIIFQDKASCFPAYLLNPRSADRHVIDACAAPGNKTTHLAAIIHSQHSDRKAKARVTACERDKTRAETLTKMLRLAGASDVSVRKGQDFLKLDARSEEYKEVGALLLDPSCSGSGIVGRDEGRGPKLYLPMAPTSAPGTTPAGSSSSKKRKRGAKDTSADPGPPTEPEPDIDTEVLDAADTAEETRVMETDDTKLAERLKNLSGFQLKLLSYAMTFPAATKITYSTCSVHFTENEGVVLRALQSGIARSRGWRVLKREDQVEGLKKWKIRGDEAAVKEWAEENDYDGKSKQGSVEDIAQACIRCEKGTKEGTMGFFVCGFVRDRGHEGDADQAIEVDDNGDEWEGFSDEG